MQTFVCTPYLGAARNAAQIMHTQISTLFPTFCGFGAKYGKNAEHVEQHNIMNMYVTVH